MANWTCDICSTSMDMNDQDSHLAGRSHATRTQEILAANKRTPVGERQDSNPSHSNWPAESSKSSGRNRPLSPKSTPFPVIRHKQISRSSPLGTGSIRTTTQNSSTDRSKTRERGTQTGDEPATMQASPTVPPAVRVPGAALTAFEFQPDEIAKPLDFVSTYGSSYVLVWECQSCNRWMPLSSKAAHLACTAHTESLLRSLTISSLVAAQYQVSMEGPPHLYDMSVLQASNSLFHTPQLSTPTSQRFNATQSQSGVPELAKSPASKPEPVKSRYRYDASQPLGLPKKEYGTIATPSTTRSIPGATALFWTCPRCKTVLATHRKAAHNCALPGPSTAAPKTGPLDNFFRSFPSFAYDAHKAPAESFSELLRGLRRWHDWDGSNPATWDKYREEVTTRHQAALTREFNLWFGTEDKIECWHALCRAVRVRPLPRTCEDCRSVIRGRHVNIVDLIEWARKGETGRIQIFDTVKGLSDYSYKNHKIYRRDQLGAGAVLFHLLREIRKEQHEQDYM